jgi:hypothetical protein
MTSYDDLVELAPVCMQQAPRDQRLPDAGRLTSAGQISVIGDGFQASPTLETIDGARHGEGLIYKKDTASFSPREVEKTYSCTSLPLRGLA